MTPKQEKFAKEVLVSNTLTEAAIKAGYAKKHARKEASNLLKKPHIKKLIDKNRRQFQENMMNQLGMTFAEKILLNQKMIEESFNAKKFDTVAKVMKVDNEMQGHNAPTKTINVNIEATTEEIAQLRLKYQKDY